MMMRRKKMMMMRRRIAVTRMVKREKVRRAKAKEKIKVQEKGTPTRKTGSADSATELVTKSGNAGIRRSGQRNKSRRRIRNGRIKVKEKGKAKDFKEKDSVFKACQWVSNEVRIKRLESQICSKVRN